MLVTTGGASVGEYDSVSSALAAEGMDAVILEGRDAARPAADARPARRHACARPARQSGIGLRLRLLFLVPLMRRLSGRRDVELATESAVLGCDLPANDERADYLRATLTTSRRGSRSPPRSRCRTVPCCRFSPQANCLVIASPLRSGRQAGEPCAVVKFGVLAVSSFLHVKLSGCGTHMEQIVFCS